MRLSLTVAMTQKSGSYCSFQLTGKTRDVSDFSLLQPSYTKVGQGHCSLVGSVRDAEDAHNASLQVPVFAASAQLPSCWPAGTPGWSIDTPVQAVVRFPLEESDFLK